MANKKITELTALTTPDNADLFAIVDISLPETKKITFADLKTACITGIVSGLSPTGSDVGATSQIQVFTKGIKTAAQDGVDIQPFGTSAGNTGELRFYELAANGTDYVGFKSKDGLGATTIYTLPELDGDAGYALTTNGSALLGWTAFPIANPPGGGENAIQYQNGDGGFSGNGDGFFNWDPGNLQLLLKNESGISFPSYSFVDAPTMGMYYDSGNVGITADSGNVLLTCAGLSINGNAGFTGTGTYINFTIENGIITSAS
jgi:hypothetical protein